MGEESPRRGSTTKARFRKRPPPPAPNLAAMPGDPKAAGRNAALDIARGLIVALMALDHVRIFFSAAQFDPLDLDQTSIGWFLTRWITHLCAPGFFFIAGLSATLIESRQTKRALAAFLLVRGLWLILLELAVFGFAWSFNPGWLWLGVIWGLGAAMILLAGLISLPRPLLLAAALAFTLLHNALWPAGLLPPTAETLLYAGGVADLPLLGPRMVLYAVLPWTALMLLGYAAGPWLLPDGRPAVRRLAWAGAAMVAAFLLLRFVGLGQPAGGGYEPGGGPRAILSFLDVEKYPASLQFSLATLGLMALFLALIARFADRPRLAALLGPLQAYGRVPFFFYLLHLFLIHGAALLTARLLGWPADHLFWEGIGPSLRPPDGYGFGLAGVWLAWLPILALLYPACSWFGRLKSRRPERWLRLF